MATFDVFLSHNSRDKQQVERIAERLQRRGPRAVARQVGPDARAGAWQDELADGHRGVVASCAVFIGPDDLGDWELRGARAALSTAPRRSAASASSRCCCRASASRSTPTACRPSCAPARGSTSARGYEDKRALAGPRQRDQGDPVRPRDGRAARPTTSALSRPGGLRRGARRVLLRPRRRRSSGCSRSSRADRFLAVARASGSGKSSLVRAGLHAGAAARRAAGSGAGGSCVVRPGRRTRWTALAAQLRRLRDGAMQRDARRARAPTSARCTSRSCARARRGRAGGPRRCASSTSSRRSSRSAATSDERKALFSQPALRRVGARRAGRRRARRCAPTSTRAARAYPELVAARQRPAVAGRPDEPRRAAPGDRGAGAARRAGVRGGPRSTRSSTTSSASAGSAPLLEHALLELWERRRGTMLTLEAYRDAGGVQRRARQARGGRRRRARRRPSRSSRAARSCA